MISGTWPTALEARDQQVCTCGHKNLSHGYGTRRTAGTGMGACGFCTCTDFNGAKASRMHPERIQRRRTKGWRMPEGAVYVGRGSKWGNPWRVIREGGFVSVQNDDHIARFSCSTGRTGLVKACHAKAVSEFYRELTCDDDNHDHGLPSLEEIRAELAGKDLCCWCPADHDCHADVLLDIANRQEVSK